MGYLCGAPRGQKDLAKFARQMSRGQRLAPGIRRNRKREIPSPTRPTFCRLLRSVDARAVETAILAFQEQVRGPRPQVARERFKRLDLENRLVGADALHTQTETGRVRVQEKGADYSLTAKDNPKGLRKTIVGLFAATEAAFSP